MPKTKFDYFQTEEDEVTFTLIDEDTVARLQKDGTITLPQKTVDATKDMRWNMKQLNSKLLQGILNGDPIPKIAQSFTEVIGNNEVSTTRAARTMCTNAENGGRLDSYKNLEAQGVIQKKVWIATPDDRTREAHLDADGQEVDVDEPFELVNNDGSLCYMMYPADPDGDDEQVWNCRCSMRTHIVGFYNSEDGTISTVDHERDNTTHSAQIIDEIMNRMEEDIEKEPEPQKERVEPSIIKAVMSDDDYEAFMDLVNDSEISELYRQYGDTVSSVTIKQNGGYYQPSTKNVVFSYNENEQGRNRYSTLSHEYSHHFDHEIGKSANLSYGEVDLINQKCNGAFSVRDTLEPCASNSDEFMSALRMDMQNMHDNGLGNCYAEFHANKEMRNATAGIQDALDGFYSTGMVYGGWGHPESYYNREYNHNIVGLGKEKALKAAFKELGYDASNQTKVKRICRQYEAASEAFANVGSAITCGGQQLEVMEKYMPNTVAAYKDIIGGLKK